MNILPMVLLKGSSTKKKEMKEKKEIIKLTPNNNGYFEGMIGRVQGVRSGCSSCGKGKK